MTLCAWPVAFSTGKVQRAFAFALFVFGVSANAVAATYVEGAADGWYAGTVTGACMLGWMLQFGVDRRAGDARLRCRIRVASHMVYWYGYAAVEGIFFLVMGLVMADLLNQSIPQTDPLTPSRAELFGEPEMSREVTERLTQGQRMVLIWKVVLIEFVVLMPLFLLGPVIEYYRGPRCRDRTPRLVEPRGMERRAGPGDGCPDGWAHGLPDYPPDFDHPPRGQIFSIAHRLSTVAAADHVVFLDEGRVLEQGTHTGLMARADGNYRRFVDL